MSALKRNRMAVLVFLAPAVILVGLLVFFPVLLNKLLPVEPINAFRRTNP